MKYALLPSHLEYNLEFPDDHTCKFWDFGSKNLWVENMQTAHMKALVKARSFLLYSRTKHTLAVVSEGLNQLLNVRALEQDICVSGSVHKYTLSPGRCAGHANTFPE